MDSSSLISTTLKTNAAFLLNRGTNGTLSNPACGISWNDAELAIDWRIKDPILSKRDQNQMSLKPYRKNPAFR
jgi:dTDP-4-dehydrorhamnose 3,5-epimerase-like enzyme